MFHFPLISQNELVLDQNKNIMPSGKIDILDPVSTNPIDVYTYDAANDRYVIATNPIILNAQSRAQHTYFVTQLAYCRLSKFLGATMNEFGVTAPQYEFVRDWYGSFDQEDAKNDTIINGMDALRDANTDLGKVTVVGYWTDKDCEARTYVWDPQCTQDQDGGYIVKNNDKDNGRWILMFDGEYLPSTYYGVYPGRETQMNNLLNYVDTVGTGEKPTAKGIYFQPGVYDASTVALITQKKVLLDADTQFTRDSFEVADLKVVGKATHWICDFWIDNPNSEAHSSWFKSVAVFWRNGANTLILDKTNYFVNTAINSSTPLNDVTIIGNTRIPATYGENGVLRLNHCTIVGSKIFNSTDKIAFLNTDINDSWWNVPADIDFHTKVSARSSGLNKLVIENFANTTAFINAITADGRTALDLAGRDVSILNVPVTITELRNVIAETISCSMGSSADIVFRNVTANSVTLSCRYITVYDSDISFQYEPTFSAMWGHDSRINSSYPWQAKSKQIICDNCYIGIGINMVTDNTSDHGVLEFTNCEFQQNVSLSVKRITMKRCVTSNNTIKVYPRKTDSTYYIGPATFENCVFNNNNPIEFTKNEYDDECYECIAQWTLIGNSFEGNDEGVRCRYWQNRVGSNYRKTFIKLGTSVNTIEIKGNTGKCPAEDFYGSQITCPWNADHNYWQQWPGSQLYYSPSFSKRVFVRGAGSSTECLCKLPDKINVHGISHNATEPNEIVSMHSGLIVHSEVLENIYNGDFFKVNVAFIHSPGEHDNYARYVTHIE